MMSRTSEIIVNTIMVSSVRLILLAVLCILQDTESSPRGVPESGFPVQANRTCLGTDA